MDSSEIRSSLLADVTITGKMANQYLPKFFKPFTKALSKAAPAMSKAAPAISKAQPAIRSVKGSNNGKYVHARMHAILSGYNERKMMPPKATESLFTPAPEDKLILSCDGPDITHFFPCLIAFCYLLLGIFLTTVGYRYLKYSMPVCSFTLTAGLNFVLLMQGNFVPMYGNYIISTFVGIVFSVITHRVICVGLICSGFQFGVILGGLATWIYNMIFTTTDISTSYMGVIIVLLLAGMVGAILSVYFPADMAIASTCVTGSVIMTISLDYLVSRGSTTLWVFEKIISNHVQALPCLPSLSVCSMCPIFIIIGIILQRVLYGNSVDLVPCKNACFAYRQDAD